MKQNYRQCLKKAYACGERINIYRSHVETHVLPVPLCERDQLISVITAQRPEQHQ